MSNRAQKNDIFISRLPACNYFRFRISMKLHYIKCILIVIVSLDKHTNV